MKALIFCPSDLFFIAEVGKLSSLLFSQIVYKQLQIIIILQLLTENYIQTYGKLVIWCVHFEDVFNYVKFVIHRLWLPPPFQMVSVALWLKDFSFIRKGHLKLRYHINIPMQNQVFP